MNLELLDFDSDYPAELWVTGETAFHWRAEQTVRTYWDYKLRWLDCEPAGPQMRTHP